MIQYYTTNICKCLSKFEVYTAIFAIKSDIFAKYSDDVDRCVIFLANRNNMVYNIYSVKFCEKGLYYGFENSTAN